MTNWLIFSLLTLAPQLAPPAAAPVPIADNSFLIEEAYNQEPHVVQHINVFARQFRTGSWAYSFTQEWPINRFPKNQFSYTLSAVDGAPGGGAGDSWVNWRYQVRSSSRLAVSPRASLILPTGNAQNGRGAGGLGLDLNLPISVDTSHGVAMHSNFGATLVPRSKNAAGDVGSTSAIHLGQSVVWQTRPRFNVLVEALYTREQELVTPTRREWRSSVILSPGIRWAYNCARGLQIVPGLAVPIELTETSSSHWSVLGYLSFEHPFGAAK